MPMALVFLTHPPEMLRTYYGERALSGLRALAEVRLNPIERDLDTAETIAAARGCDVIVSHRHVPAGAELFGGLPELIAFCRCAVDIRTVDVAAASERGVLVTHASAGFIPAAAEWVIGAMIALSRSIVTAAETYHRGEVPAGTMGQQLKGSTIGVIGYGQIGRYLSQLAIALGMRVLVCDPYAKAANAAITEVALPELLAESDYVVCLAVATVETENLMNAAAFAHMRPTAFFVNASRGNLVDEDALEQALDQGRIAGCAMDVGRAHDHQPTPELARHPKVIATPHIGGLTPQAIEHQALETVDQVREILAGRIPKGAVNAEHVSRLSRMSRRGR
jgi:D-3-phosphoglycerate dehydrogenase